MLREIVDGLLQLGHVAERGPLDRSLGDQTEPALHLTQPGGIGRGEVQVVPGTSGQPSLDLRMFVGRIVVNHQVDLQIGRHLPVDQSQESQEVLMAVALLALGDHPTGGDVQRHEQGGRAMADIIVSVPLDIAETHGQGSLGAVQSLDLGLFVDAQHHRMVGWIQIQADDVSDFLDEEGIVGQLEGLRQVRLDPEPREPTLHRALGDAFGLGHQTDTPVLGVVGLVLQGPVDQSGDLFVVVAAGPARTQAIVQSLNAEFQKASAPLADSCQRGPDPLGHGATSPRVARMRNFISVSYSLNARRERSSTYLLRLRPLWAAKAFIRSR